MDKPLDIVMGEPLDIDALRRSASRTDSPNAVVCRKWLARVALEIAEGRAAKAQLAMHAGMTHVIDSLQSGAQR
ncbi:MAG TPA: hypothetical protein VGB57_09580 [Allosphingosinicella sp.]|jgi:hypothetical protein